MKPVSLGFLVVLGLLAGTLDAGASSGSPLDRRLPLTTCDLVLRSESLRQVTLFNVDVYWVGLYLELANAPPESVLCSNQVKAFVFHFVRDVKSDKLQESWIRNLAICCPADCRSVIAEGKALARRLPDIQSSQEVTYVLFPERVEIFVAGEKLGTLLGEKATRAILATFVGPKASSQLRKDLLRSHMVFYR